MLPQPRIGQQRRRRAGWVAPSGGENVQHRAVVADRIAAPFALANEFTRRVETAAVEPQQGGQRKRQPGRRPAMRMSIVQQRRQHPHRPL